MLYGFDSICNLFFCSPSSSNRTISSASAVTIGHVWQYLTAKCQYLERVCAWKMPHNIYVWGWFSILFLATLLAVATVAGTNMAQMGNSSWRPKGLHFCLIPHSLKIGFTAFLEAQIFSSFPTLNYNKNRLIHSTGKRKKPFPSGNNAWRQTFSTKDYKEWDSVPRRT